MRYSPLALALALAACQTTPNPKRTYERMLADYAKDDGTAALNYDIDARQREKCAKVVEWYEEGLIRTPEDHLFAARILATSDVHTELELARVLAVRAAELGEEDAYPVQAEAIDRLLLKQGLAQRYGTQYVWEPLFGRWRHYAVDPLTTDELREAMGILPLAELRARVKILNAGQGAERLRSIEK